MDSNVNTLCLNSYDDVYKAIFEKGTWFRNRAKDCGLGSGNSIAEYVSREDFMGMIDAVKQIRKQNT